MILSILSLAAILAPAVPAWLMAPLGEYVYERPFINPAPLWGDHVWPWLLLPLCLAVAIVYKSIKCRSMSTVPREALVAAMWILIAMGAAGAALAGVVKVMER